MRRLRGWAITIADERVQPDQRLLARLANFGLTPKEAAPMARVSSVGKITALVALGLLDTP